MTRDDLPPGVQAVQAAHAALDFALAYPDLLARANTLVLLAVPDELGLVRCHADATAAGLRAVPFNEPDLGGALTAVALEPSAHRLVSHLPLALAPRGEVRT